MTSGGESMSLSQLSERADHSWLRLLTEDPDGERCAPNKISRQVKSGHYVRVKPDALKNPKLVAVSPAMVKELGLSEEEAASPQFAAFFSGDLDQVEGFQSWATPYALSIMGQQQYQNCPFGNGNGYGDGRAISVGEVVVGEQRWEMQLKGGGTTPFCRGGDGRAVLRSSVREFLASEAMHALGIETTRALSLVVSIGGDTSRRPWYSNKNASSSPEVNEDDPRLAHFPIEIRRLLIGQMANQGREPDIMIEEPCAITCRVAPSFLRIGHIELQARRACGPAATPEQKEALAKIVEHALFREYPEIDPALPLEDRVVALLEAAGERLAAMVAGWLRVGFCQGNFNCDNCLVGGRTMDYGPFGWMDKYDPGFAKWINSGDHYAFINQPGATLANFQTLAESVRGVLGDDADVHIEAAVAAAQTQVLGAVADTWRRKMGFSQPGAPVSRLWKELDAVMRESAVDFTVMWRELAAAADLPMDSEPEELLAKLEAAFYKPPPAGLKKKWLAWLENWHSNLATDPERAGAGERMRAANPKYIPREWILVEAYEAAAKGDYSVVEDLYRCFSRPYDEQPEFHDRYYGRAPDAALARGGTAFMT